MSKALKTVGVVAGLVSTIALALGHPEVAAIASVISTSASPGADTIAYRPEKPMTAISMFSDNRQAYLVTDSGLFDFRNGNLVSTQPKVLTFPEISMAIAMQGWGTLPMLMDAMSGTCTQGTQTHFMAKMPEALAGMRLQAEATPLLHSRLWIGLYDRQRCAPRMFTVQSGRMPDGDGEAFVMAETDGGITGLSNAALERILPGGWPSDPVEHGRRIFRRSDLHRSRRTAGCTRFRASAACTRSESAA